MKKLFISMMLVFAPLCAMMAQDVVGKWKLDDGSAIVEIYRQGDVFNGKIVWLQHPTQADGSPAVDANNPDSKLTSSYRSQYAQRFEEGRWRIYRR